MASLDKSLSQQSVPLSRARVAAPSRRLSNHWKFSISVMGATPKQRSIYINTWIDIKASAKKKQAVRTIYGQYFHIKHASDSISLDLYVHDIQNNLEISRVWDSIVLNVIVLPFNHTNSSVDKPLKQLIRELNHTKIALRRLFSKTLLICPSNFSAMTIEEYITQTKRVSDGLLHVIHNGLGQYNAKSLNLLSSDIVMMESGRKSSTLPTGKDWRVIAAEYALKHLIFSDRERKAFIAWILNIPNPLKMENIMLISQRLKNWKTSRRQRLDIKPGQKRRKKSGDRRRAMNVEKGSLRKSQRPKLSAIVRDFDASEGLEATMDNDYKKLRRELRTNTSTKPPPLIQKRSSLLKVPLQRFDDEKLDRVDPNLAALMLVSEDESDTELLMLQKINKPTQTVQMNKATVSKTEKKTETFPKTQQIKSVSENVSKNVSENVSEITQKKEKSKQSESKSDDSSSTESDDSSSTDSDDDESDSESETESDSDSESESESRSKKNKKSKKRNTKELKRFCANANLDRYYHEMVSLGFNSSSEFLDLDDSDLDGMILKLKMVFKDEIQFRKCVNTAKIACGMKEEEKTLPTIDIDTFDSVSVSPLSDVEYNDNISHFYDSMEPGISKLALIDLNQKLIAFSKMNNKCGDALTTLNKSYKLAQIELDRVYTDYTAQIESAHKRAMDLLHSFVVNKRGEIVDLQKRMKSTVNALKECETQCDYKYKNGKQDAIPSLINAQMNKIVVPTDFSVASGKFSVEFADKLDIFPPILQPDIPAKTETPSHHSRQSTNSLSLQDIIEGNLNIKVKNGTDDQQISPINATTSPLQNQVSFAPLNVNINASATAGAAGASLKPKIRRNSIILGDLDPNEQKAASGAVLSPQQQQLLVNNNPYNAMIGHPYNAMSAMNQFAAMNQQQLMMNHQYMNNMMLNQMQQQMHQRHLHQHNQQQPIASANGGSPLDANGDENIKKSTETTLIGITRHSNEYSWLETKDLWRSGRVTMTSPNCVTITGSVCVVADIEINAQSSPFIWEIYVEKISNRCWIGIIPGPISSIDSSKIGECPPVHPQSIGIENTYGIVYCGATKCGAIGRAPRNRDHIRFKLDLKQKVLFGSLNDATNIDQIWYKGDDIPQCAAIVIINSTGKGKFQIRH